AAKKSKPKKVSLTKWVPKATQDTKPWRPRPKAVQPAQRFVRYDGMIFVITQTEPGAPPEYRRYEVPGEGARLSYTTPDSPAAATAPAPSGGLNWSIGN
ncbi:MAG: hypothetical protein HY876_03385, partial [Coriobacteriales bacterium]|nr:hypothetical protein [Coriobacteriales bacterium]